MFGVPFVPSGGLAAKLAMAVAALGLLVLFTLVIMSLGGAKVQRDVAVQNLAHCVYELDLILDEIAASDNLDRELYDRVREYQWKLLEPVEDGE